MRNATFAAFFILWALCPSLTHADHLVYADADVLALEITFELVPPVEVVGRIERDLAAIRALDPLFDSIRASPSWEPGEVLVSLTPAAWDAFNQGTYTGLDALNQQYSPVEVSVLFESLRILHVQFARPYHPMRMATLYAQAQGVDSAQPLFIPRHPLALRGHVHLRVRLGRLLPRVCIRTLLDL